MTSIREWLAGTTDDGVALPLDRVRWYRRKVAEMESGTAPAWETCRHRGEVSNLRKANLCGRNNELFPVYRCALHGECVLTRFCEKQPERLCHLCEDAVDHLSGNEPPQA